MYINLRDILLKLPEIHPVTGYVAAKMTAANALGNAKVFLVREGDVKVRGITDKETGKDGETVLYETIPTTADPVKSVDLPYNCYLPKLANALKDIIDGVNGGVLQILDPKYYTSLTADSPTWPTTWDALFKSGTGTVTTATDEDGNFTCSITLGADTVIREDSQSYFNSPYCVFNITVGSASGRLITKEITQVTEGTTTTTTLVLAPQTDADNSALAGSTGTTSLWITGFTPV